MKMIPCKIPGLLLFAPDVYKDERGYFKETFNEEKLAALGFKENFVQDNESLSGKGVIRALHFQHPPMAQGKLVRVIRGSVMDVAVDLRKGSPYFGQHEKVLLSADNHLMFWLPTGFAHGFVSLEDHTVFTYKCTNYYSKVHEGAIRWNDPDLNIDWGIQNPVVSSRDGEAPAFRDTESMFVYGEDGKEG